MFSIKKTAIGTVAILGGGIILRTFSNGGQSSILPGVLGVAAFAAICYRNTRPIQQKNSTESIIRSQVNLVKADDITPKISTELFKSNPINRLRRNAQGTTSRLLRASRVNSLKNPLLSLTIPSTIPTIDSRDPSILLHRTQIQQPTTRSYLNRVIDFASGAIAIISHFACNMMLANSIQRTWQQVRVPHDNESHRNRPMQTMGFERDLPSFYSQEEIDSQQEIGREHEQQSWEWAKKFLDDAPNLNWGSALTDIENAAREKAEAAQAYTEANRMESDNAQRMFDDFWRN